MNTENITVNAQSSIRIAGSKTVYFDPFRIEEARHDADLIFITHAHYDHLDPGSIANIAGDGTIFVAPASMEKEMRGAIGKAKLYTVTPGESLEIDGIAVEAVPAYNRLKPFHPRRNQWTGYIVTMDGVRYYAAGDTDAVAELKEISCDVALVPIGGTYTMTAKEAAKLVNEISPQVAIPTHYGSIVGKMQDAEIFRKMTDADIAVETRL